MFASILFVKEIHIFFTNVADVGDIHMNALP